MEGGVATILGYTAQRQTGWAHETLPRNRLGVPVTAAVSRQIQAKTESCWPASLTKKVNFWFSERLCLTEAGPTRWLRWERNLLLRLKT